MKNKSFKRAFAQAIQNLGKNIGNFKALKHLGSSICGKVYRLLYQKLSIGLYQLLHYKQYNESKKPLYLVYTMAKVGSSSMYNTLRLKIPHSSLFHVHFLTQAGIAKREKFHNDRDITSPDRALLKLIEANPDRKLKIITLVREPVSRNISDLFESLSIYFPHKKESEITLEELMHTYNENGFHHVLNWFDEELNQLLDFDIYQVPFNKEEGYQIYKHTRFDLLVLRLEDVNKCFGKALAEFTNRSFKKIVNANESKQKSTAALNASFKKNFRMDKDRLETLYSSTYVKHFYSQQEIQAFITKFAC